MAHDIVRETRRLYGGKPANPNVVGEQGATADVTFAELDALLACARPAHPPSTFGAQVMECVAQRGVRQRAVRRVRRVLTVMVLLMAMVAGTVWLVSTLQASNAPILAGLGQVFEQLAAILQSLAVAVRVIARTLPGSASLLLGTWIVVALGVTALWFTALAKTRGYTIRA